jgi:phytol kinase
MPQNDWIGLGLFFGYILAAAIPALLIKVYFNPPFEWVRKMLHLLITFSIFPLILCFSTWTMAILAALLLVLIAYPALKLVENTALFKRLAVEREGGEFARSLIVVQVTMATLIFIFWGLLGESWRYVAIVAVMAWGLGDAAAALIGKAFGRRRILHRWIQGTKTVEGTLAMYLTAGLAMFISLVLFAGKSWDVCLLVALLVAPVSAGVELFSNRGMDTLTVPLSTAFAILPLMSLISFFRI